MEWEYCTYLSIRLGGRKTKINGAPCTSIASTLPLPLTFNVLVSLGELVLSAGTNSVWNTADGRIQEGMRYSTHHHQPSAQAHPKTAQPTLPWMRPIGRASQSVRPLSGAIGHSSLLTGWPSSGYLIRALTEAYDRNPGTKMAAYIERYILIQVRIPLVHLMSSVLTAVPRKSTTPS